MKAQLLLNRTLAKFGDATGKAMQQAFDEAWTAMAASVGSDLQKIADTRLKLAQCIVNVTPDGFTDVEGIKSLALIMLRAIDRKP